MRKYPHIYAFSLNAYYEQDSEIKQVIQKSYSDASQRSERIIFDKIDLSTLRKDIDSKLMYTEILYAVDGYMLNKYRCRHIAADEIEQEISTLIDLWKTIYTPKQN